MRNKVLSFLLLVVMLASAACTAQATPAAVEAPAATGIPATQAPTEAPTAVPEPRTLTVMAAASLTESFTEIGKLFESRNAGVTVSFNFAGSQALAEQLNQGAEADVFASASKKYMTAAIDADRVNKDDSKIFAQNALVVIFPKDNPAGLKELKDIAKPGVKLDLADKSVPVGQYSLDFLDKAVEDTAFGAAFKDDVLKNVISYEDNVKSVLTKVSLGEADAGIVYVTDITADAAGKVDKIEIPNALNTIASYPIAPISDSKNAGLAWAFVDLVLSSDGQTVLGKSGFLPAPADPAPTAGISVTDALGRTVTFSKIPEKIVLSGKSLFMIADAIYLFPEAGSRIAALGSPKQGTASFLPMIDPAFKDKIILEKDAGAEQIAAIQPDCVILKSSVAESLGKPLEELKIPVVYIDFETPEQYDRDLKTLGRLFQNPARAELVAKFFKEKADGIIGTVSGLKDSEKVKTLVLYYNEKDGAAAFNVPPMGWMQTQMIQMAGGVPVWEDANPAKGWTKVNFEQVAAWNPDTIFVISYFNPVDEVVAKLESDAQWSALDAVKNGKVFAFATDVYSWDQPDPRWILGLTWVAGKLYPDLFPGLDIKKEAQSFYSDLYGMDEASFKKNIEPIFIGDID